MVDANAAFTLVQHLAPRYFASSRKLVTDFCLPKLAMAG
jgi:hypothetical protein